MPVVNADIASQLARIADLLDIEGANPFRVRAYRKAARMVGELPRNVADMPTEALDALPGIGKDLGCEDRHHRARRTSAAAGRAGARGAL